MELTLEQHNFLKLCVSHGCYVVREISEPDDMTYMEDRIWDVPDDAFLLFLDNGLIQPLNSQGRKQIFSFTEKARDYVREQGKDAGVITPREAMNIGVFDKLCEVTGLSPWAVNEGMSDSEPISLTVFEARMIGIRNSGWHKD